MKKIQIEIDTALAKEYFRLYSKAFPCEAKTSIPIETFISNFTEDRLKDEIAFVEEEAQ